MDGEIFPDAEEVPHELADYAPTIQRAEYCLYLYLKYGPKFVERLNGAFVIAVLDSRDRKVHLYNDRFGSEPIYLWTSGEEFAFSTSQRSLLNYRDDIGRQYDRDALAELLVFERILGEKTLFKDIRRLVPASHAVWDNKQLRIEKYWSISDNPQNTSLKNWQDAAAELFQKIKRSVFKRLSDNAKVGVLISGGIDSRLLLDLSPVSTIAATFSNKNHPHSLDTRLAVKIAKLLGHKHVLIEREIDHYAKVAELAVDVNESMRIFTTYHSLGLHQKMLDAGIQVVLTGDWWGTLFKGCYSIKNSAEYSGYVYSVNRNEPELLKARYLAHCCYYSLIIQKPRNQDLLMLALSKRMKEQTGVVKEKILSKLSMLILHHKEIENCAEYFILPDLQSWAVMGFQRSINKVFPDRSPAYDNDLFSFALNIPVSWKKGGKLVRRALRLSNPKLARIIDANTGISAGLCPPWSGILWRLRKATRCLSSYFNADQSKNNTEVFMQNSSWHNMNALLKQSDRYRSMIENTINNLDEEIFDKKVITKLFCHDIGLTCPRLNKLWEIILTFGLFDQKYGPNVNRKTFSGKIENCKILDLTKKYSERYLR
jgi:asparagine synthetase B (glutamine-hydrolysing)